MTNKEAIIQLKDLIQGRKSFLSDDEESNEIYCKDINALNMAIQALKKQIPKKPKIKTYECEIQGYLFSKKISLCPMCKNLIGNLT